jgi:SAM-dependent methyltransferase
LRVDKTRLIAFVRKLSSFAGLSAGRFDHQRLYRNHVLNFQWRKRNDVAMQQAIGGEFAAFGAMERDLLVASGLTPGSHLVDVGCGSGRLAHVLAKELTTGRYLGIDVVPDLLAHAKQISNRPDFRFEPASGFLIPEKDGVADFVVFFSVLTHLLHEESFSYLREATRVLKPGGKIVFSFLEFAIPSHWAVFEGNLEGIGKSRPLNQFISRAAIAAWAQHLDLKIEATFDGDKPHIPLRAPLTLENGRRFDQLGALGQSVCVLVKPG